MGYATAGVKMLALAKGGGAPWRRAQATLDRSYPIARPLYMYTVGEPEGETKRYLDWIHSPAGQRIVAAVGYVPLPVSKRIPLPLPATDTRCASERHGACAPAFRRPWIWGLPSGRSRRSSPSAASAP